MNRKGRWNEANKNQAIKQGSRYDYGQRSYAAAAAALTDNDRTTQAPVPHMPTIIDRYNKQRAKVG